MEIGRAADVLARVRATDRTTLTATRQGALDRHERAAVSHLAALVRMLKSGGTR